MQSSEPTDQLKPIIVLNMFTGEFYETFNRIQGQEIEVKRFPKKNHKLCHGRGYIGKASRAGTIRGTGGYVPCSCVMKAL